MTAIAISQLIPQVCKLQIKHPVTGETEFPLPDGSTGPLEIWLVGRNSKEWFDYIKKIKDSNQEVEIFSKVSKDAHELMSRLIIGWLDNGAIDNQYSKENALDLISNPQNIWLLEQLQSALIDEANFFLKT